MDDRLRHLRVRSRAAQLARSIRSVSRNCGMFPCRVVCEDPWLPLALHEHTDSGQLFQSGRFGLVGRNHGDIAIRQDLTIQVREDTIRADFDEDRHSLAGQPADQIGVQNRCRQLGNKVASNLKRLRYRFVGHTTEKPGLGLVDAQSRQCGRVRFFGSRQQRCVVGTGHRKQPPSDSFAIEQTLELGKRVGPPADHGLAVAILVGDVNLLDTLPHQTLHNVRRGRS